MITCKCTQKGTSSSEIRKIVTQKLKNYITNKEIKIKITRCGGRNKGDNEKECCNKFATTETNYRRRSCRLSGLDRVRDKEGNGLCM